MLPLRLGEVLRNVVEWRKLPLISKRDGTKAVHSSPFYTYQSSLAMLPAEIRGDPRFNPGDTLSIFHIWRILRTTVGNSGNPDTSRHLNNARCLNSVAVVKTLRNSSLLLSRRMLLRA